MSKTNLNLPLPVFVPARMSRGSGSLIIGSAGSGKTALLQNILKCRNLRNGAVFTNNTEEWGLNSTVSLLTNRISPQLLRKRLALEKNHFIILEDSISLTNYHGSALKADKIYDNTCKMDLFVLQQSVPETPILRTDFCYIFLAGGMSPEELEKTILFVGVGSYWDRPLLETLLKGLRSYEFLIIDQSGHKDVLNIHKVSDVTKGVSH